MVTVDCADPRAQAAFWSAALGWTTAHVAGVGDHGALAGQLGHEHTPVGADLTAIHGLVDGGAVDCVGGVVGPGPWLAGGAEVGWVGVPGPPLSGGAPGSAGGFTAGDCCTAAWISSRRLL